MWYWENSSHRQFIVSPCSFIHLYYYPRLLLLLRGLFSGPICSVSPSRVLLSLLGWFQAQLYLLHIQAFYDSFCCAPLHFHVLLFLWPFLKAKMNSINKGPSPCRRPVRMLKASDISHCMSTRHLEPFVHAFVNLTDFLGTAYQLICCFEIAE